jgi:hypothetical protein
MLWLKLLLGYCVLVGVGMWFGYRSRKPWPPEEAHSASGFEVAGAEAPVEPGAGSATGLR